MDSGFLLDSNVIIGYLAAKIPASGLKAVAAIIDNTPHISVISQMEVLRHNDTPENEKTLMDFINSSIIHPLSEAVVQQTIALAKKSKIKLPDAIIAATSLIEGFTLVTRNIDDFKKVNGLKFLNPWSI
ncbi:PIN domain protein [Treponema primitia ZAS-2]|uniref:PIN domain protein n=1 Tax=Treponema primitia (strain ATCC BAA-887 / DSM 12427 / ZAS-2) TaxID=545694 RepID=F5YK61_TREPZ|nr:type II toxin-antitoxin system VapC family toxin [Treponema primitia]AEF85477.1 PIN domain protein [Treponema primitia ZAS-2]